MPGATGHQFEPREAMHADCSRCFALCCVALAFRSSSEFAADKAAGTPCPNLVDEQSCGIHDRLITSGYRGCVAFDCFGAGQHVTQVTFAGYRWRDDPARAATAFAVFDAMRRVKELLWHLADASSVLAEGPLQEEVREARIMLERLTLSDASDLERLDVLALQDQMLRMLTRVSNVRRSEVTDSSGLEFAAEDLSGAKLEGANLRGADLRYAQLSNAVLAGADLFGADLFGANMKDADIRGARLADSLFLTQLQVEVTSGDGRTTVPAAIRRPDHWTGHIT